MNDNDEELLEHVLDRLNIPEPDLATKAKIMKAIYFLAVAKEVGAFQASIPITLFDDSTNE